MSLEERKRISPQAFNKIDGKRNGLDVVKKAIEKAQEECVSAEET